MIGLRSVVPEAKIVNFEDDGEGILKADLVFNALYHQSPALAQPRGLLYRERSVQSRRRRVQEDVS